MRGQVEIAGNTKYCVSNKEESCFDRTTLTKSALKRVEKIIIIYMDDNFLESIISNILLNKGRCKFGRYLLKRSGSSLVFLRIGDIMVVLR